MRVSISIVKQGKPVAACAAPRKCHRVAMARRPVIPAAGRLDFISKDDDSQDNIFDFASSAAPKSNGNNANDVKHQPKEQAAKDISRLRKKLTDIAADIGSSHVELRENLMQQRNALEQERTHTFRVVNKAIKRASNMEAQFLWSLVNFILPTPSSSSSDSAPVKKD
jgi:hypothetical protein